jgi:hypothetical protein
MHVDHVGAQPLAGNLERGSVRVLFSKKALMMVRPESRSARFATGG